MFVAYGWCMSATNEYIYLFFYFLHCFNSLSRMIFVLCHAWSHVWHIVTWMHNNNCFMSRMESYVTYCYMRDILFHAWHISYATLSSCATLFHGTHVFIRHMSLVSLFSSKRDKFFSKIQTYVAYGFMCHTYPPHFL